MPLLVNVPARPASPGGNDSGGNSGGGSGNSSGGNNGNGSNPGNGGQTGNNNGTSGAGQSQSSIQPVTERTVLFWNYKPHWLQKEAYRPKWMLPIEAAVKAAPLTGSGQRLVEFRLKSVPEAASYELALPVSSLLEQKKSDVFRIVSAFATIELPADLLAKEGAKDGTAAIRLIRSQLPQGIADRVGTVYGVQLEFSLNHQTFMPVSGISIELPYTPSKDSVSSSDKIVAVQISPSGKSFRYHRAIMIRNAVRLYFLQNLYP